MKDKKTNTQIISLDLKRGQYGRCRHLLCEIDEALNHVTCKTCGEKLNPMDILKRLAVRIVEYNNLMNKYKKRSRVKCIHCKKMVPIRVK